MKNNYPRLLLLLLTWLSLFSTSALRAQTPPTIQWQKLMGGSFKQAPNGDYYVASGDVFRLGSDGTQRWRKEMATYFADDIVPLSNGNSAVLAHDSRYYYKWAVILLNPAGDILSTQPFETYSNPSGTYPQATPFDIVQAPDGGITVLGTISYGREGTGTSLYQFTAGGSFLKQVSIELPFPPGQFRPNRVAYRFISLSDGYLVVGSSYGQGWAVKLNSGLDVVWSDRYSAVQALTDVIPSPFDSQAFIATGINSEQTVILTISPTNPGVNNTAALYRPSLQYVTFTNYPNDGTISNVSVFPKIVSDNSTSFTVMDGVSQRSGDIRMTNFGPANQVRWTKILGGSATELAGDIIATQDGGYLFSGLTQSADGDVQGKTDNTLSGWLVKLAPIKPLALNAPVYDCSTGAITLSTSGGDGTAITYTAPGIIRSSTTSNTGTVEPGLRNDPKPITITATQGGQAATYSFDLKAFCSGTAPTNPTTPTPPPTTSGTLTLIQPTYDCTTGAITFNTSGGNGTAVTYTAPGITRSSATSNTGTVEPGLRNDPKVITITATQGGQTATYNFDLKAFCSGTAPTNPTTPTPPPTTGGTLTLGQPTYNCTTGAITFNTSGGNGTPITYTAPGITRSSATSNTGTVEPGLRNDPKVITITATQSGQTATYSFDLKAACSGTTPLPPSPLTLLAPVVVSCASRQITLVTSGGDGTPVTFSTPTITRSSPTSLTGTVDFCVGAQPPVLQATQSGYTTTYDSFDFVKACPTSLGVKPLTATQIPDLSVLSGQYVRLFLSDYFRTPTNNIPRYAPLFTFSFTGAPIGSSLDDQTTNARTQQPYAFMYLNTATPGVYTITITGKNECGPAASSTFRLTVNPGSLTLTQPTYTCATGAITFNTSGGDGTPIEFQAAGITGWTTNPNQFVDQDSRTASDVKPFTLMARQSGQVVTYTWDLKAVCGRSARRATTEAGAGLQLRLLGNPVTEQVSVQVDGNQGQPVRLQLLRSGGQLLDERQLTPTDATQPQVFQVGQQHSGLLLLRATSGTQQQTIKVLKQ